MLRASACVCREIAHRTNMVGSLITGDTFLLYMRMGMCMLCDHSSPLPAFIGVSMLMRSHIARGRWHRRMHVCELASQEYDLFRESATECREITHCNDGCGYRHWHVYAVRSHISRGSVLIRASAYASGRQVWIHHVVIYTLL